MLRQADEVFTTFETLAVECDLADRRRLHQNYSGPLRVLRK